MNTVALWDFDVSVPSEVTDADSLEQSLRKALNGVADSALEIRAFCDYKEALKRHGTLLIRRLRESGVDFRDCPPTEDGRSTAEDRIKDELLSLVLSDVLVRIVLVTRDRAIQDRVAALRNGGYEVAQVGVNEQGGFEVRDLRGGSLVSPSARETPLWSSMRPPSSSECSVGEETDAELPLSVAQSLLTPVTSPELSLSPRMPVKETLKSRPSTAKGRVAPLAREPCALEETRPLSSALATRMLGNDAVLFQLGKELMHQHAIMSFLLLNKKMYALVQGRVFVDKLNIESVPKMIKMQRSSFNLLSDVIKLELDLPARRALAFQNARVQ